MSKTYQVTMTATYTTSFEAESEDDAAQLAIEWLCNDPESFTEAATITDIKKLVPAPTEQVDDYRRPAWLRGV